MNRRRAFTLLTALLCVLMGAGVALAQGTPSINWWVIGGGGGHVEAAPYALDGTMAQAVVGVATNAGYDLCSGFWCGAAAGYQVYLPLVLRND